MKEKACGNCKHFKDEDLNGWTLITQDNEEEVYDTPPERLVIANIINGLVFYSSYNDMSMSIVTMAKFGGYYYYVLPELKIE